MQCTNRKCHLHAPSLYQICKWYVYGIQVIKFISMINARVDRRRTCMPMSQMRLPIYTKEMMSNMEVAAS